MKSVLRCNAANPEYATQGEEEDDDDNDGDDDGDELESVSRREDFGTSSSMLFLLQKVSAEDREAVPLMLRGVFFAVDGMMKT